MYTYTYRPFFAADAYGTGTYGSGSYECGASTTTCPTASTSLVDTGSPWFIPVMLGSALIIAAVILVATKFLRRRKTVQKQD